MSVEDAVAWLRRLQAERLDAREAGVGPGVYLSKLEDAIAAARTAYVCAAVTELAALRAQLDGAPFG